MLIEGGSLRGSSQIRMSEGEVMRRVLGRGSLGRGGLRGARIAGTRANRIQGSVSTGLSNSTLDAKPYSLDGSETPDPGYLSWTTGVAVGGPLLRTGSATGSPFFGRRAPFFFANFSTNWGEQLGSQYASVPTGLERQGDFSQTVYPSGPLTGNPVRIYDPFSGQPYSDSVILPQQINSTALELLAYLPLPNRDDPFLNFLNQQTFESARNRVNTRIFHSFTESFRLMGGYNLNRTDGDSFHVFPGLTRRRNGLQQNLFLSLSQTLGGVVLHTIRVGWNRNRSRNVNPFAFQRNVSAELGISNTSLAPIDYGLPTVEFTNYTSLNDGSSSLIAREENTFNDSLQVTWRGHHFRIGGEVGWNRWNLLSNPEGTGTLVFAGVATSTYQRGMPMVGTGYDLADFLLGLAQSSRIQYGNSDHYLRRREYSFFFNDNWRVHSRLTLQWGIRYQYLDPWMERYDRIANLDVGPGFSAAETVVPGSQGSFSGLFPRALVQSDRNNLAPRLALAYRLRSGQRTSVLRANYGVFYPHEAYDAFARELISQPPFGFAIQETATEDNFLPIESAFPISWQRSFRTLTRLISISVWPLYRPGISRYSKLCLETSF